MVKQGQRGSGKFKGCQEEGIKGINTGQEWVKLGLGVSRVVKWVFKSGHEESRGSQRVQKGLRRF